MSNVNRAVTRTRRAHRQSIGALPWPGPARYKDPGVAAQLPQFTVSRRVPRASAGHADPMAPLVRLTNYRKQRAATPAQAGLESGGEWHPYLQMVTLTPRQLGRAWKEARRTMSEHELTLGLPEGTWS